MLTEPVDGLTEMLPAVVAEIVPELCLPVDEHDAPRVQGLASTYPAAPADVHDDRIPVPDPDDVHGASSSPRDPTVSIDRAAEWALAKANMRAMGRNRPRA
jgi:hypothetical protein